jgi:hypothetical protein
MISNNKLYQTLSKEAQKVVEYIYHIYHNDDVCIGDLLGALIAKDIPNIDSLTVEDWFYVYMTLMSYIEGDHFYRSINDGEPEDYERDNLSNIP